MDDYDSTDGDEKPKRKKRLDTAKLNEIHEKSLIEFATIQGVMREERLNCLRDRRFVYVPGAQWEGRIGQQFKNRPKLEVNKVAQAVDQIVTDYRNNKIDVSFVSKDGALDKMLADTCAMLHRADVQDSNAEEAYSNAFEEAVAGGLGAWRLKTCYEDDDTDEDDENSTDAAQRIRIEPIYDADRFVFFDLAARMHDKSDARHCYVITPFTHDEYEQAYPDRDFTSWPETVHQAEFDWATADAVYLVEKFCVEWSKEVRCYYRAPTAPDTRPTTYADDKPGRVKTLFQSDIDDDPEEEADLLAMGYVKYKEQKVKRKRVHKYLMDGGGIVEDCGYIVGREIPIIMVYAKRYFIDNVERCHGHVRHARDLQQIKNMLLSKLAEISAISSVEKPIVTPEQILGLKGIWADDNIDNNPYLPINKTTNADGQLEALGPVGWTKSAAVPPATAALHAQVDLDMKEILGNQDQGEKVVSHTSSKTVEAIHRRIDAKSALYLSNLGKAIRWSGKVWLGMAPEVYYQPGRKMKGVGPRNEMSRVELHKPMINEDGDLDVANDLSRAKFDVAITVGPSSESRKAALVDNSVALLTVTEDPETKLVLTLDVIVNSEGEGGSELPEWARKKLVKMGVYKATEEEAQAMQAEAQNAKPAPIEQLALAQAKEAEAKAGNSDANRAYTMARTEKTQADTAKVLADVGLDRESAQIDAAKTIHDMEMAKAELQQSAPGQGSPQDSPGSS